MNPHFWWYVARATGLIAWALATAAVLWGLFLHTRALGKRTPAPWLLDLHRHLGGLTVLFVLGHIGALVADNYTHFGVREVLLPMASSWQPGPVAWGVVAFYGLLAVELTSLAMRRVPKRIWRGIHLTSYLTFVLATVHGITAGTDMANPVAQWGLVVGLVLLTFFGVYRQLDTSKSKRESTPEERARRLAELRARAAGTQPAHPPVAADGTAPAAAALSREERIARAKALAAEKRAAAGVGR